MKKSLSVILVALFCLLFTACGADEVPTKVGEVNAPVAVEEVQQQTEFGVGDVVELNDIKASLVSVTENNGSSFNEPSEGNVFVLCEFEIENGSTRDISVSSLMSFEAYQDDYACNLSISALLEAGNKNQLDGTIAAGKKLNGVVGYEVPSDWKNLEIRFAPDFWSSKDITFVVAH